ncbi:hypothetical protein CXU13_00495 [Akkermansia muciniphila]|nr:hypothetical protein CXU13_00495 [Akkermansia muciniphila]
MSLWDFSRLPITNFIFSQYRTPIKNKQCMAVLQNEGGDVIMIIGKSFFFFPICILPPGFYIFRINNWIIQRVIYGINSF